MNSSNTATTAFNEVIALFQTGLGSVAIVLIVLGAVDIGTNFGENGNRVALLNGFMKIVGGGIIGAAAYLLGQVKM